MKPHRLWLDRIGPPVPMWVLLYVTILLLAPWWVSVPVSVAVAVTILLAAKQAKEQA